LVHLLKQRKNSKLLFTALNSQIAVTVLHKQMDIRHAHWRGTPVHFWLGHNYRRAGEMLASFCGAFDVPLVLLILTQVK